MEKICLIIIAVICSGLTVFYNNREILKKAEGIRGKQKEAFKLRKNTIATLLISILGGGALAVISYEYYDATLEYAIKLLLIFEFLIPIAYVDLKKKIIPNKLLVGMLLTYVVFFVYEVVILEFSITKLLIRSGLGLLLGGGVFLLSAIFSKGGMGMGDVKLFAVLGMLLGWQDVFIVIFISIVGVAVAGIILLLIKKVDFKSTIPIGPFALMAMAISVLLGI